jgi:UDP-N-acetylmuramoyl-tripeptide--D-alanyl-D-alanine ligase
MVSDDLLMTFTDLARDLNARLLSFLSDAEGFSSVSIDSRNIKAGSLFIALKGNRADGHRFIGEAFKQGALCAMVEEKSLENSALDIEGLAEKMGKSLIVVENTLTGLQDAARIYLEKFPNLIKIGITGSSGKTTTKEIAAAIIGQEKNIVMNPGNLNSETGLPLSVFAVRSSNEAGIFEMGMNRKGEIAELARILKPNIALVTNIGSAHIGMIGSLEGIAEEKKNIFSQFGGNETALIPSDEKFGTFLGDGVNGKVKLYGLASFEELEGVNDLGLEGSEILWAGEKIHFALPGKHNLRDAFAGIALARELNVSNHAIREGLESVKPLFGRSEILSGKVTVIRDCYNANPESTAEVLSFCDDLEWQGKKVYVIGAMLELGANSEEAHEKIGKLLSKSSADMVFLFGEETQAVAKALRAAAVLAKASEVIPFYHTVKIDELSRALDAYIKAGDLVLLKGSRGCALERLTGMLTNQAEGAA